MSAYSVDALADRWGCTSQHLYRMIRDGELKAFRVGSAVRIAESEVERIETTPFEVRVHARTKSVAE